MHEGPTENRLGELGSLYKCYYYYYYYYKIYEGLLFRDSQIYLYVVIINSTSHDKVLLNVCQCSLQNSPVFRIIKTKWKNSSNVVTKKVFPTTQACSEPLPYLVGAMPKPHKE